MTDLQWHALFVAERFQVAPCDMDILLGRYPLMSPRMIWEASNMVFGGQQVALSFVPPTQRPWDAP